MLTRDHVSASSLRTTVDSIGQDVRFGFRMLWRSPGFATAAILTFALGIGANTAIFSIVDAAILRPLPYDEPHRLFTFAQHNPESGRRSTGMMPRDFLDWRERTDLFEQIALVGGGAFTVLGAGEPEQVRVARVSAGFFEMMRMPPAIGRLFSRTDEEPGHGRIVILSHAFWSARYGADPAVIGRAIRLDGEPYEIVGVLPERFTYPAGSTRGNPIFLPFTFTAKDREYGVIQSMISGPIARLKDGRTAEVVAAALSQMQAAADVRKQAFNKGYTRIELTSLTESYVGRARSWMLMLLGAVLLVLLIACANVANLIIAHGSTRARELTVRGALGASRWRLARQLLSESLLLSLIGAIAGIAVAWLALGLLRSALPPGIPRASTISLDLRVLGFTIVVAIVTGVVCGLGPAFQGSRLDLVAGMKEGGASTAGKGAQRVRHALAWVEVALAVMLLVGAGLFISSFVRLLRIDHGFDARGLVAIDYASQRVPEGQARDLTYLPRMLAAVREVPGIEAALVTAGNGPFFGGYSTVPLRVVGRATPPSDSLPGLRIKRASTGFLEILRVPILRGRSFTTADSPNAVPAVIINHAAARQFWPGENPLGQRLEIEKLQWEIVGIAADMRYSDPTAPPVPEAFLHYEQSATHGGGTLLLRAAGDPLSLVPAVKAAVWAVNPAQALTAIQTVEDQFDRTTAARRFNMLLMSIFAALALVIAGTGIFGVIAFLVGRRTREIGVRISLGAQRSQVLALFLRQGIVVVGTGIAAGLCGSWMLARTIEKFLFEVQPRDPVVFAAVAVTLGTIGIAASWLPARRAARIDPVIALRHE